MATSSQQNKFILEKQANALLRGERLTSVGPIGILGRVKSNGAKLKRRARRKAWFVAQTKFRRLPADQRRDLTGRFRAERLADPDLNWGEFLLAAMSDGKPGNAANHGR
jgi:hypothetical protein